MRKDKRSDLRHLANVLIVRQVGGSALTDELNWHRISPWINSMITGHIVEDSLSVDHELNC
jgi:hypothetical protein